MTMLPESGSRVDVIVPCYRYAHLLRACVESVLKQRGVNVRVLILDDASPDETESVARRLMAEDDRVEYRRHAVNQGHIDTFNEGLAWSSGEYTLLLSADDLLMPGALHRGAHLLERHPQVGFVYGQAVMLRDGDAEPPASLEVDSAAIRIISGERFLRDACATGDNIVLTPTVIVRRTLQHRLGGYRKELVHAGDFEMWMRFAVYSDIGRIDAPQAIYRVHGQNMSSGYSLTSDLEQRQLAFEMLFDEQAENIIDAQRLRAMSMRTLATTAFWAGSHLFDAGQLDACRPFHRLALRIDPSFRRSSSWRKFQLKRLIGSKAWRAVAPVVRRLKTEPA